MKSGTLVLAAGVTLAAATALAHSGATGVVKQRMDAMGAMGNAVKRIAPMFRGETDYDAAAVREAAEIFRAHAGSEMTELFPAGSAGAPSEARETIWSRWDDFERLAKRLETYAGGLALAAGNAPSGGDATANSTMMGGSAMMGSASMMGAGAGMAGMSGAQEPMMEVEDLAKLPPDVVFEMVSQTCAACHARFRADK